MEGGLSHSSLPSTASSSVPCRQNSGANALRRRCTFTAVAGICGALASTAALTRGLWHGERSDRCGSACAFGARPNRGPWKQDRSVPQGGGADEMWRRAGGGDDADEFEMPAAKPIELREMRRKTGKNQRFAPVHRDPDREVRESARQARLANAPNLEKLLALFVGDISEWPAINIATAWNRLAKHSRGQIAQFEVQQTCMWLSDVVESRNMDDFNERELSNMLWAIGTLRYKKQSLLRHMCKSAKLRLEGFDSQALANTVYALMMLEYKDVKLLAQIADDIVDRIDEFKPQEISNVVYAAARLDFKHLGLMRAVSKWVPENIEDFKPQEISNILYAFQLMKYRHNGVMTAICDKIAEKGGLRGYNTQNIANTAYAVKKLGFLHEGFIKAVAKYIRKHMHDLERENLLTQVLDNLRQLQAGLQDGHLEPDWNNEARVDPVLNKLRDTRERRSGRQLRN